jgi:uncharacterized membrane protein (UPF0127 family)
MNHKQYLQYPFESACVLKIQNEEIICELAETTIEIFQSLNFRSEKDFTNPLVIKFENPNIQSYVLSNYIFPVEHICVSENKTVEKMYLQGASDLKANFIQAFSSYDFVILAPIGFIKKYGLKEKETTINTISSANLEEYKATDYIVYNTDLVIKIGEINKHIDNLLQKHEANTWAFITAYNPYSKFLTDTENINLHKNLINLTSNYITFEGEGKGQNPDWKPEKSLLILGLLRNDALTMGKHLNQNAIVFGEKDSKAELLLV